MKMINLVIKRRTVRSYMNRKISDRSLMKILEAGRWAPSLHNLQPWYFVVITNRKKIIGLSELLVRESSKLLTSARILSRNSFDLLKSAPAIVLVYNTKSFSGRIKRLGEPYFSVSYISEIQSIAAAIENMNLEAFSLGIGMAWLTTPLLVAKNINNYLKINKELVAILSLGYPDGKMRTSKRKSIPKIVGFIK